MIAMSNQIEFHFHNMEPSRYVEDLADELSKNLESHRAPGGYLEVFVRSTPRIEATRFIVQVNFIRPGEDILSSRQSEQNEGYTTLRKGLFHAFASLKHQLDKESRLNRRRRYLSQRRIHDNIRFAT